MSSVFLLCFSVYLTYDRTQINEISDFTYTIFKCNPWQNCSSGNQGKLVEHVRLCLALNVSEYGYETRLWCLTMDRSELQYDRLATSERLVWPNVKLSDNNVCIASRYSFKSKDFVCCSWSLNSIEICIKYVFFIQPRRRRACCVQTAFYKRRSHNRFSYYPNANATFNILLTSGDIELNPGPTTQECNTNNPQRHTIPVISGTRQSGPRSNRPPADFLQRKSYIQVRSYKNYNSSRFAEDIGKVPWHILDIFDNTEEKVETFNNLLSSVLDSHAPLRTVKVSAKPIPFMTSEIKDLMIARDRSHRKARRSGVERDWSEFKEKRRITKQRLREAEIAYIQEQIKSSKGDSNSQGEQTYI